jgi:hypothetical protein
MIQPDWFSAGWMQYTLAGSVATKNETTCNWNSQTQIEVD